MERIGSNTSIRQLIIIGTVTLGVATGLVLGIYGQYLLMVALIIAIPLAILSIMKPWIAVSGFFLFFTMEHAYSFMGAHGIRKILGAYLLFLLIITGSLRYIRNVFVSKKIFLMLLFVMLCLSSVLYAKYSLDITLYETQKIIIYIVLYIVLLMMIRDIKTLNLCTWALLAGGVISVLWPLLYQGYWRTLLSGDMDRLGGMWGDPNIFAATVIFLLPLCFVQYINSENKNLKIAALACFGILLTGLILTYSRTGFISLMALIVISLLKLLRGRNKTKILALTLPVLIGLFSVFYFTVADQYIERINSLRVLKDPQAIKENSLQERYYMYFEVAPKLFAEHPFIGVGYRQFLYYNRIHRTSHNMYIEILCGLGIIGFTTFMAILYMTWKELRRVERTASRVIKNRYIYSYATALELGFYGMLVANLFYGLENDITIWMIFALAAILVNLTTNILRQNHTPTNPYGRTRPAYYQTST